MNKKFLIAVLLLFCAAIFLFIGHAFLPKKEIALDQANKIFVAKGDVKIKKAKEGAAWQKMESSTVLEKGDIVETSEGATVDITIGPNADKAFKIKEKSRVELQGINPADINLSKGKVLVTLKNLEAESSFVVKTPTAISGARGTAWSVETGQDRTRICVFENKIFVQELGANGKPKRRRHIVDTGTQRVLLKDEPISEIQPIAEDELRDWEDWSKSILFLREGKILINDFDKKENFNNLDGDFGSWNVFYSDPEQKCVDEITDQEKIGDKGCGLRLSYDVDAPFSSYNGFFTKLMNIDISDYNYLVFYIKGDKKAGYTKKINIELKNRAEIGKTTVEGITDEWRKMVIPLGQFAGIRDFKEMKEFVIVFSDINVTKKEGIIYIDDIYFAKAEPAD